MLKQRALIGTLAGLILASMVMPISAAPACTNTADFAGWLKSFKAEAVQDGISAKTLAAAGPSLTFDPGIIRRDRAQGVFQQPFIEFAGRMVSGGRIQRGRKLMAQHADIFARTEQAHGVPAPVITAFWALESDFGSNMGKLSSLRSLTTLAYDCRRPDMFRAELKAALRIVQSGDLKPAQMLGSWAGELGQTQFLPVHYVNHAVDIDCDGRRDLLRSVPDLIGSTGKYIAALGWKRGQPWLDEVRVPANLDWAKADLAIKLPRANWAKAGVTRADGKALSADALPASLLLPMGRNGPAFLVYENFNVYTQWNNSLIYSATAAHMAARMAGAPKFSPGKGPVKPLTMAQIKDLQMQLSKRGLNVGSVDGKLGSGTRAAVKAMQQKFALPADSYPTAELIARLKQ